MGPCPAEETLIELVEGRLTAQSAAELHRHVRNCEDCRHVLAGLGDALATEEDGVDASVEQTVRIVPDGSRAPPGLPPLAPGERVGRFQVERGVGEGGMGTVYAARDPELGRTVALKLLRVKAAAGEDAAGPRIRLLREAQAMARLAHPNVVTVFEVGTFGEQVFLAMELVEGGTLTCWLAERALAWQDVLHVFIEAGRGLAAAHAAGLVHRDFKPDNVLVSSDGRVRVMDFGLARAFGVVPEEWPDAGPSAHSSPGGRLTKTGALLGTPAYMAPEQMRAQPVDARADLFSFCSSLYEALYGQRAYLADTLAELQRKIEANEVSPPPGRRVPSWTRRELLRGLRADPAERHATMDELLAALTKGREWPARRKGLLAIGALAALAVLLPVGLRLGAHSPTTVNTAGATTARRAIAVLTQRNLTARPEKAWLAAALAEMMSTEIAASRQLRVIPGENVAVALRDLKLSEMDAPGQEALRKLSANLGADLFLSGSFAVLDGADQLRIDLRLHDAHTGHAVAGVAEVGEQAKLFELVASVGSRLRREMGAGSSSIDPPTQASFPANPEAARLFSEGLVQLRGFEPMAAKDSFERAAKVAPTNPRILAALAEAYTELGEEKRAGDAARRAFENVEGLPRDERLSIEGVYRRTVNDWRRAVEIGRALVTFFPDDIEYRLRLGYSEIAVGDLAGVLATVEALRKLPPPAGTDPRIDLLESEAQRRLGDLNRSRDAAVRAVVAGRAKDARRVVALGRLHEGWALRKLGDQPGALAALREAQQLFHGMGDRSKEARATMTIATLLADRGDLPAAQAQMEAALAVFRELSNRSGEEAVLANLGVLHWLQHQLGAALQRINEAIAMNRETGNRAAIASSFFNRGNMLRNQGDLEAARRSYEASLGSYRELGIKVSQASPLVGLADIAIIRDELAQARKLCHEAEALQVSGEKVETAQVRSALARLALAEGRFHDAEKLAEEARQLFHELDRTDPQSAADAIRARALLGRGRREEAASAVAQAREALLQSKAPSGWPAVAIADAHVAAAGSSTRLEEALNKLKELLDEARAHGEVEEQLDLRLALAQLQPRRDAAKKQLKALVNDARQRGFLLVAREAQAALNRPKGQDR